MSSLPIDHRLLLKPWFAAKALARAEEHLTRGAGPAVIHYRQAVAGIFAEEEGWCLVRFEAAPQISQGFRLVAAACSFCTLRRQNGDLCSHLAALSSRVLVEGEGRPAPAPLAYGASRWAAIARFLGQHGDGASLAPGTEGEVELVNEAFRLGVAVADEELALARTLFPDQT